MKRTTLALLATLALSTGSASGQDIALTGYVPHAERAALLWQVNTILRRHWHTPRIRFASDGWRVTVLPPATVAHDAQFTGDASMFLGFHSVDSTGQPYAEVTSGDMRSIGLSHELTEMLVNPRATDTVGGWLKEIADPVANCYPQYHDVDLSDFVYPAWFTGGPGPYDMLHQCALGQHDYVAGYATLQDANGNWVDAPTIH